MTNGGWLGDCKVSGEPQTEPVTDAESAELYRLIEAGAKAERDQQWQAYNADQDKFLRLRLWQKYEEHIDALDNLASGTLKKYQRVFGEFAENCAEANLTALPAAVGTVATYLDHKLSAGASPETIRCVAAAISCAHEAYEERDPTTALLVRGIVRAARAYKRKKLNGNGKNH